MTSLVIESHRTYGFRALAAIQVITQRVHAAGKRFTVKATPMASVESLVAQVIDALGFQDLDPGACRLLAHEGKRTSTVDQKQPFRFANITKTAKLELITGREQKLGFIEASPGPSPDPKPSRPTVPKQSMPETSSPEPPANGIVKQEESSLSFQIFQHNVTLFTKAFEVLHLQKRALTYGAEEHPDAFYDFTEEDYRRLQVSAAAKKAKEASSQTLMTRHMRELDTKKRAASMGEVIVRAEIHSVSLYHADQESPSPGSPSTIVILQVSLPAAAPLRELHTILAKALESPPLDWYIYVAPPKTILRDLDATVYALGLYPRARVHVVEKHGGDLRLRPEVRPLVQEDTFSNVVL